MERTLSAAIAALFTLAACGGEPPSGETLKDNTPPPLPENAVSETFERAVPERMAAPAAETAAGGGEEVSYWGVKPGEPLPIIWEDLMPDGGFDSLDEEYAAFYAMLEQRYAAMEAEQGGAFDMIEEGSDLDYMPQLGSFETVTDLDGQFVRIPGYVVPFDFDPRHRHKEFLFAPYMGACIHTPPPPPNQLLFVTADPSVTVEDIYTAYWLEGTLTAARQDSELASAAYTLTLTKIEPY